MEGKTKREIKGYKLFDRGNKKRALIGEDGKINMEGKQRKVK